jgi:hypothetical protein
MELNIFKQLSDVQMVLLLCQEVILLHLEPVIPITIGMVVVVYHYEHQALIHEQLVMILKRNFQVLLIEHIGLR